VVPVTQWKNQAIAALPDMFTRGRRGSETVDGKLVASLYEEIGRLKVELSWLKKQWPAMNPDWHRGSDAPTRPGGAGASWVNGRGA
jgi:hypothetical protein